jgi:MFS family permease
MLRGLGRATINPSLTAMFSNVASVSKRGRAMGIFNAFQNIGLVVGSSLGGFLYEMSSSETPFIACFIVALIGVIVVLFMVSEPKDR